jgi:photosystem II stability/assembly factor-like uncharacterized protein
MSTSGGSAWSEIDVTMDDGYALALPQGAVLQAGCWTDTVGRPTKPAVFRTTNEGSTWQRKALFPDQGVIRTLCVSPTALSTVYAAGYSYSTTTGTRARIFKSTDAGVNWTKIGAATFDAVSWTIEAVAVDPFDATRVLVGTSGGIYLSTDAGSTWTKQAQTFSVQALVAHTVSSGKFYAGTTTGVWESSNGGQNWTQINNGLTTVDVQTLAFDGTSRKVFAGTDGGGVYRLDVLTDVPDRPPEIPAEFALEQNYPNPFNPTTVLSWQSPVAGWTKLSVYDLLGREVATLMNEKREAGSHSATFDGAGVSSGTYVYRLEVVGQQTRFIASKVMTLVK